MKPATVRLLIVAAFLVLAPVIGRKSKSRFTNLKCESYDRSFSIFKKCKLNVLGRGVVAVDININLLKLPIYNVHINWSIWRRYNTYQPFLHNASCDFCHLLSHPNKIAFESLVLKAIQTRANINHTCPYNHDVIVDNLVFTDAFLQSLPLPQGDYKIQLRFATDKTWRLMVEVFILRDE
ncbi:uncharacterized protein [Drosophila virilis]|uniref:Uncharacterized protein, isoform A n=1 Tax=Drosophila virilis TaxID=7244 RepID=B4LL04_DROVI|nr:uncharacterized protein LOC6625157 [Drosophila virilis]XP_032292502.1 uncharacterized protein LOC6625157 [Drosophila virilis]XP_032292503.1 uncharacterized protein LOC6625157 [Drosophila virilis]EDW61811.1 uncharacterized protein Dvir_GJ20105, isoform A [Drosophila virilis]KRF80247.1 uncharacterized protein Dvir_GJ20105, isoform B [Drosophila virilis]KRF80248.1 uncharacterized protein Dvir_GJ20105, isoform C [Drosophila virilis]KRF80249.1 uncharacterized protein Dvir_GJ20105, isoform D [Dr